MTARNLKILVCDHCKTEVTDNGDMHIGGHPFQGWFEVKRTGGGTSLHALEMKTKFDICSIKCLREYTF